MRLAACAARDRRRRPVVGVTGSVGKTSTKDLACGGARRRAGARGPTSAASTTIRACPPPSLNAPDDTEVMVLEMGMRGFGEIARAVRHRPADDRRGHPGGRGAQRPGRRHRRRGPGQGRAGRGAPGRRHRGAERRRPAVRGDGRAVTAAEWCCSARTGDAHVRVGRRAARPPGPAVVPADTPWGRCTCGWPSRAGTWCATPQRRWRASAWSAAISTPRCRGAGRGAAHGDADGRGAHCGRARRCSTTRTTRIPPRCVPRIDALCRPAGTTPHRRAGRDGRDHRRPSPSTVAIRAYAADRGVEVMAVGTDLYGLAPVRRSGVRRWVRSATATRCS